jgi:streptogramin lyase
LLGEPGPGLEEAAMKVSPCTWPAAIKPGPRSKRDVLWFALVMGLVAAGFAAEVCGQIITEPVDIPTGSSNTEGIVTGLDGNLWFCEEDANQIGRLTLPNTIDEFPVPTAATHPETIIVGPDGNLWYSAWAGNIVGRVTLDGVITEFHVPTAGSEPEGVATGPDGNVWFTENKGNKIGRLTTSGVFTEFPIPTPGCRPEGITAGPDGNLWFVEQVGNKVGRITTAGVITEFPIPTASASPWNITAGPDGNLWFGEDLPMAQVARITPSGVITEFPVPSATASTPDYFAAGPDGNVWFTEYHGNRIGRVTPSGVVTEYPLPSGGNPYGINPGPDGALWFPEATGNKIGRITTGPATPQPMEVDARTVAGTSSNANGVLEAGETVQVDPSWNNTLVTPQDLAGMASNLTGPAGPTYTIDDDTADYGTIPAESVGDCDGGTGDCYLMSVTGSRPAPHWDATFTEDLNANGISKTWVLHIGESFPDVPTSHQFYRFVENLFHNGVTGGCGLGNYCPSSSVTRAQMAVFLLKGKFGSTHVCPPATGAVFNDVGSGDFAAAWIESLAGFKITGGCGGGNYCPNDSVTRAQMAAFLLKSEHGSAYVPPGCAGIFGDVACPSLFADWIEQLAAEGITGGCGGGNYCPNDPITRGQMAVFLVKTFGLQLYGP